MVEKPERPPANALEAAATTDDSEDQTEELKVDPLLTGQELFSSFDQLSFPVPLPDITEVLANPIMAESLPFEEEELSELIAIGLKQIYEPQTPLATPQQRPSQAVDTDLQNLERLYAQHGLWQEQVSILEHRITGCEGEDRVVYMLELARLLEAQLGDLDRAMAAYRSILELAPTCNRALARLIALHTRRGQWSQMLEVCETQLERLSSPMLRLPIVEAMAQVYEHQLDQPSQALTIVLRAVVDDGPDPRLIHRLARLASLTGSWADTMGQLSRDAVASVDPARQSALFCVLGSYYLKRLDLPHHALTCFGQALLRYPRNSQAPAAMVASIHACLDRGRIKELCAILPRLHSLMLPTGFVDRLADTAESMHRRGEEEDARALLMALLVLDPDNDTLFATLAKLLEHDAAFDDLLTLHRQRIDLSTIPCVKLERQLVLVDLLEHVLSDPKRAIEMLLEILAQHSFNHNDVARKLARLASTYECWDELLGTCIATLGQMIDGRDKAGLCRTMGLWYVSHLQSAEAAIPLLRCSLLLEPETVATWLLLAEVHRILGHHRDLADSLSEAASREDDPIQKAAILMDLGKGLEVTLQDKDGAVAAYTACIELDPTSRWASTALHRLCPDESHDIIIERAITSRLRLASAPKEIGALHLRLAELYASYPDRISAAIDHCRSSLDFDPNSEMALLLLERIYSRLGNYDAVVDTLHARLGRVTAPQLRVWLLLRLAETLTAKPIHDSDRACDAYEQVLELEPHNEAALRALAENYRRSGRRGDLARVLERLVLTSRTEHRRLELLRELGRLYLYDLKDLPKAGEVFGQIGHIAIEDAELLASLAAVHERSGNLALAVEAMIRLATLTHDPRQRAEVLARIGRLCTERLHDDNRAREYFEAALELDPDEPAYLEELETVETRCRDWSRAIELLRRLIAGQAADDKRSEYLLRLGDLLRDQRHDEAGAVACFEQARSLCPTNTEAMRRLLDVYEARGAFDDLEHSLRQLTRSGLASGATLRDWHHRLAGLCERRGDLKGALEAYQAGYDIDPRDTDSLLSLAAAQFNAQQWAKALRLYSTAITDPRHSRGAESLSVAYYRAGVCQSQLPYTDPWKAEGFFAKAVELNPQHLDSLNAMIASAKSRGDRARTAEYLSFLPDLVEDQEQRRAVLLELADLYEDLDDTTAAATTYRLVLEGNPTDRATLAKLAATLVTSRSWREYASTMERMALLCPTPKERSEVLFDLACTMAHKARNRRRAVDFLEQALDANPAMMPAFEKLDKLLTRRQDWAGLERAYQRMIQRVDANDDPALAASLWQTLGKIYRSRLHNRERAIEAFEQALHLRPDEPLLHRMLAELYAAAPTRLREAQEHLRWLIRGDPMNVRSHEMLFRLYDSADCQDEAFCASVPLAFLEQADARQRSVFEAGRGTLPELGTARLEPKAWPDMLGDGSAFEPMVRILEAVSPSALSCVSKPPWAYGLRVEQRVKTHEDVPAVSLFRRIADTLGIEEPVDLYLQPGDSGSLSYVLTEPRASACPEAVLRAYTKPQLVFLLTRHLFYYSSRHYVRWLALSRQGLETLILAALATCDPRYLPAVAKDNTAVKRLSETLRGQMSSAARQRLNLAVDRFSQEGARIDVQGWMKHLDLMSTRLAFVLCNDLFTAVEITRDDATEPQLCTAYERIADLLTFCHSAGHFALRRALGTTVAR